MINNQNLAVLSEKVAYLESAVQNSNEASEISYNNTDSGLTADDVQDALDEVAPALTAEGTSYDNTDSGLTATNVNAAIDEVNAIASGVVSSGSNANGEWVKFSDGTMICTKQVIVSNLACQTAWGALYEADEAIQLGDFAQPFYSIPRFTVGFYGGNAWPEALPTPSTTGLSTVRLVRATVTTLNGSVCIVAIGRWKA